MSDYFAPLDLRRAEPRQLSSVQSRSVSWLVPGLIPLRAVTLLAGVGGLGKSTFAMGIAASETLEGRAVVLVSYEDAAEEILRPRLLAAGGDPQFAIQFRVPLVEGGVVILPDDLDDLEKVIRGCEATLTIVDPLVAALDTQFDAHKDQHVRAVMARVVKMAEDTDSALLGIAHLNKTPSSDAYIRINSSTAFYNLSRSVLIVTREDDEHRLVSQHKSNWARESQVQRYRLEEIVLPDELDATTGRPIATSKLTYVGVAEGITAADVLATPHAETKAAHAEEFLRDALADGDWHDSRGLMTLGKSSGFSERTLKRAAQELGVERDRRGFPSVPWWRLAQSGQPLSPHLAPVQRPLKQAICDS